MNKKAKAELAYLSALSDPHLTEDEIIEISIHDLFLSAVRRDVEAAATPPVGAPASSPVAQVTPPQKPSVSKPVNRKVSSLTDSEVDEIWAKSEDESYTQRGICGEYRIAKSSLYSLLQRERQRRGVTAKPTDMPDGVVKQIRTARRGGRTLQSLSDEYEYSLSAISRRCKDIVLG